MALDFVQLSGSCAPPQQAARWHVNAAGQPQRRNQAPKSAG
jgi:hypothetical protein